jgi:probable DNA repair protein
VPQSFVHLHADLERACRETVVLTTTERLRRNLSLAFNEQRRAAGERAWQTPRIRTLDGYLASGYQRRRLDEPDLPDLLSDEAEFELFRLTAPDGCERLVPLAQEAWTLCHHWQIDLTSENLGLTENGRIFLDWAERIRRRLHAEHALTRAELPGLDIPSSGVGLPDKALTCVAFEQIPSAYQRWLEGLEAAGTSVASLTPEPFDGGVAERTSFASSAQELSAAAQWARELLSADPDGVHIGIVIPDLASRYEAVVRQFNAEFDPLLEEGTDALVDIGGGMPLGQQPVWQAASRWLHLCFDELPVEDALTCFASPFLNLPALEGPSADSPVLVTLPDLVRMTDVRETRDVREVHDSLPSATSKPLGEWLRLFLHLLDQVGWTGRHTGSVQYQAFTELGNRIGSLANTFDTRPQSARAALGVLERYLSNIVFAPERSPAPIQIMGYLETTGLSFSHLWVTGLDDQSWPQPLRLNPFVPASTQRRVGIPRSTPVLETAFARDRLNHWQASSAHLIVSHARDSGESVLRPSPLIRAFSEVAHLTHPGTRGHPGFLHRHGQLETVEDVTGLPSPAGTHRGGTGRIRNQALCPFRGYAIHRLGLEEARPPHGLPDALDRGVLAHEALHRLYESMKTANRRPEDLDRLDFQTAADQALERHYRRFPTPLKTRERERLIDLLTAWNAVESTGFSDAIDALEATLETEFDGVGLRLRIDRIDSLGDAQIVIDYKTGRIGSRLNQERLVEPQLPLYALCNDQVEGVLYAEVNELRPRLKGISEHTIEGAALDPPAGGSWESQIDAWRSQLAELTGEIRAGYAAVAPYDDRACQNCHLSQFCRVDLDIEQVGEPEV